jgi:hypothetical protein
MIIMNGRWIESQDTNRETGEPTICLDWDGHVIHDLLDELLRLFRFLQR